MIEISELYDRRFLAGDDPWDFTPLKELKKQYAHFGFSLDVIEDRPPLNLVKCGLPGRDEEICSRT